MVAHGVVGKLEAELVVRACGLRRLSEMLAVVPRCALVVRGFAIGGAMGTWV